MSVMSVFVLYILTEESDGTFQYTKKMKSVCLFVRFILYNSQWAVQTMADELSRQTEPTTTRKYISFHFGNVRHAFCW